MDITDPIKEVMSFLDPKDRVRASLASKLWMGCLEFRDPLYISWTQNPGEYSIKKFFARIEGAKNLKQFMNTKAPKGDSSEYLRILGLEDMLTEKWRFSTGEDYPVKFTYEEIYPYATVRCVNYSAIWKYIAVANIVTVANNMAGTLYEM